MRFNEPQGVVSFNQLSSLQRNMSERKFFTKYKILPKLLEMTKQCLEQNAEIKQYLHGVTMEQLLEGIEHNEQQALLVLLQRNDDSAGWLQKLLLANF